MSRSLVLSLLFATATLVTLPAVGFAEGEQLAGLYVVKDQAQSHQAVAAAIEHAVADMNFFIRGFARKRLRSVNFICDELRIGQPGTDISIQCNDRPAYQTPADGTTKRFTQPNGNGTFALSQKVNGRRAVQTAVVSSGTRKNTLKLSPDGQTLEMNVLVTSPKLDTPIEYQLVYVKR